MVKKKKTLFDWFIGELVDVELTPDWMSISLLSFVIIAAPIWLGGSMFPLGWIISGLAILPIFLSKGIVVMKLKNILTETRK